VTASSTKDTQAARELGLVFFEQMLRTRNLEDEVQRMFALGLVRGTTHLCKGQEAVPNPVLYLEHKNLYNVTGPLGAGDGATIGSAAIVREGTDVTLVASQLMRYRAIDAAELLAAAGISAEVVDPRSMVPFDLETVVASVARTNRLICVQECPPRRSWGASVIAALVAETFELLDAPPLLVGGDETSIPYAGDLEAAWLPTPERIADAARLTVAY